MIKVYFSPDDRHFSEVYFKSDTAFLIINVLFSVILDIDSEFSSLRSSLNSNSLLKPLYLVYPPPFNFLKTESPIIKAR